MNKTWTSAEEKKLSMHWMCNSRKQLARMLKKDPQAISRKAHVMGLGKSWERQERLSLSYIFKALFGYKPCTRVVKSKLIARGCPYDESMLGNKKIKCVKLTLFWKWLEKHKDEFSFLKFEKYSLGYEPEWVDVKRKAEWAEYNQKRWGEFK